MSSKYFGKWYFDSVRGLARDLVQEVGIEGLAYLDRHIVGALKELDPDSIDRFLDLKERIVITRPSYKEIQNCKKKIKRQQEDDVIKKRKEQYYCNK